MLWLERSFLQGGFRGTFFSTHSLRPFLNLLGCSSLLKVPGSWFQIVDALWMKPDLEIVSEQFVLIVFSCRWGKAVFGSGKRNFSLSARYLGFSDLMAL